MLRVLQLLLILKIFLREFAFICVYTCAFVCDVFLTYFLLQNSPSLQLYNLPHSATNIGSHT